MTGVGAGVALGADGDGAAEAVAETDARGVADGGPSVGVASTVAVAPGEELPAGVPPSWMRPSSTAAPTATPAVASATAATAPATTGPRGARRARPAMPRQAGSGV